MTIIVPASIKSPEFILELIALTAVNLISILSGEYTIAVTIDGIVLGIHIGAQP